MTFSDSNTRLIIAAAALFEAKEVLDVLSAKLVPVTFIEVGIGAIKSAQIAARTASLVAGRDVLFIGSCGTSNLFCKPSIISAASVQWEPPDVRHGESYLIPHAEPEIALDVLPGKLAVGKISCSGSITLRAENSADIYENLELYSVASTWRPTVHRFWSILGVTNQLGPNAHQEWKKNFRDAAKLTADLVRDLILTSTPQE